MSDLRRCRNCCKLFDPDGTRRRDCSTRCKQAVYRKRRSESERAASILFANVTDGPPAPHVLGPSSSMDENAARKAGRSNV